MWRVILQGRKERREAVSLRKTVCPLSGTTARESITNIMVYECRNKPKEICGEILVTLIVAGNLI